MSPNRTTNYVYGYTYIYNIHISQESADLQERSLTKKQKRNLVRMKTGDLIEGLAGAVASGNILSNLKQVTKQPQTGD